jgi:CRISPR system Cascade subunit CasC
MFLQIHTLTSYHATLLNRDDAGLAKRIPFGNSTRLRISSQCLKRHWTEQLRHILDVPRGFRTRHFFRREVLHRLVEKEGIKPDLAEALVIKLVSALIKQKEGGEEQRSQSEDPLMLKQPALFGKPEADFLVQMLKDCATKNTEKEIMETLDLRLKTDKKNFNAMLSQAGYGDLFAGIEGALFGRFVTSDILARSDASVHVAHAFTVHALDTEVDYFTVVEDLPTREETGAAHAGDMELGAGIYYGYVVVDIPILISNLTGSVPTDWKKNVPEDSRDILKALVRTIATVSPGAKLGSTAPYAYSDFILFEAGAQQPRSLANAYLQAIDTNGDVMQAAADALGDHLLALEKMYEKTVNARAVATTKRFDPEIATSVNLDEAFGQIMEEVFRG